MNTTDKCPRCNSQWEIDDKYTSGCTSCSLEYNIVRYEYYITLYDIKDLATTIRWRIDINQTYVIQYANKFSSVGFKDMLVAYLLPFTVELIDLEKYMVLI